MSDPVPANTSKGVSFGSLLLLTFIILKLTKVITWSWWWVLAPAWIPLAIVLGLFIIFLIVEFFQGK